jgi:hydrocephalus-inducing protein
VFCCVTGIDASNLASIFEEHVVLPCLDPFQPINCSFGLKDKVFNFGTLIAQLPDLAELASPDLASGATPRDGPGAKKAGRPSMSAKQAARASIAPGAAAADGAQAPVAKPTAAQPDTGSLLDDPAATKANLKFINPKKVPCTVNFSITPTNGAQPGKWLHPKENEMCQKQYPCDGTCQDCTQKRHMRLEASGMIVFLFSAHEPSLIARLCCVQV